MRGIFYFFSFFFFIVSCTTNERVYPIGIFGQEVKGNEYSVSISNVWKSEDGLSLANKHCSNFKKEAIPVAYGPSFVAYYDCVTKSISGNKNYVVLTLYGEESEALPYAESHCKKFNRSARYKSSEKYKVIFDCE
jgi:hypothetical protein